ncbi:MAG: hypothetical protein ACTSUE_12570 [Promethearchaeota archaeon]
MKSLHFLFLFPRTHAGPDIPLKALTSQGKRFDVAARVVRAAIRFNPAHLGTVIEMWFGGETPKSKPCKVTVNPGELSPTTLEHVFHSELRIARFFKKLFVNEAFNEPGMVIEYIREGYSVDDHFLKRVRKMKENGTFEIIMLHEEGSPAFQLSGSVFSATGVFLVDKSNIAIVIGNNEGFSPAIRDELETACDKKLSLQLKGADEESRPSTSYLGSQVISIMSLLS